MERKSEIHQECRDGIGITPNWYQRFDSIKEEWLKKLQILRILLNKEKTDLTENKWNSIKEHSIELESLLK